MKKLAGKKFLDLLVIGLFAFGLFAFSGCSGGGGEGDGEEAETPAGNGDATGDEETTGDAGAGPAIEGTATVSGTVKLEGQAPEMPVLQMTADPKCLALHKGDPPKAQQVEVGPNGELHNAFVYVSKGLEGKRFPPAREPVKFDQKGCVYQPHVFGVRVNQPVEIHNSDPTTHNVHTLPTRMREFNQGQPQGADPLNVRFNKPEIMVRIKCDIHPWMNAYAGVVEHPFFAVTGQDGSYEFPEKLPPGEYTISVWQEQYGKKDQQITVGDGEDTKEVSFTYQAK